MVCCLPANKRSSNDYDYNFDTSLLMFSNNSHMAPTYSSHIDISPNNDVMLPKLKITLDLPDDSGYLPTYWPGQKITGRLKINDIHQTIKVNHLRIVLFGHVQVYGSYPGHPITNGLFDYEKNEQLIHTGLRVIKNPQQLTLETTPIYKVNSNNKIKKTPQDKYFEKFVKKVATFDHINDMHIQEDHSSTALPIVHHQQDLYQNADDTFELEQNHDQWIDFSIRIPTRVIGTLDHLHYPISYRIVVLMDCEIMGQAMMCYSTKKIRLESFFPTDLDNSLSKTDPSYQYIHQKNQTWLHSLYTKTLSSSQLLSNWIIQQKRLAAPNCYIKAFAEMTKPFVERGEFIPFNITLENNAFPLFKISTIQVRIELRKRINMICSMNEAVDQEVIQTKQIELKNDNNQPLFFNFNTIICHIPQLIRMPKDSACSITSKSTKEVLSLNYDIILQLTVMGCNEHSIDQNSHYEVTPLNSLNIHVDQSHIVYNDTTQKSSLHLKYYTFKLDPLTFITGNKRYP